MMRNSLQNVIPCSPKNISVIKDNERLKNCLQIKESKEIQQLNARRDPGLKNKNYSKGQYWDNWQNLNIDCMLDSNIVLMLNILNLIMALWLYMRIILVLRRYKLRYLGFTVMMSII